VVQVPADVPTLQASQDPVQALSQHTPSAQGKLFTQSDEVLHVCPCLFLHAPVASQVPVQTVGSSWFFTATHTLAVQVWHAPEQSLRLVQPTH
jgi:hypothetical protein